MCYIYCQSCRTYLFVGLVDEIQPAYYWYDDGSGSDYIQATGLHPAYRTIGELLYKKNATSVGYPHHYTDEFHTFDRCPDCMGETFVCNKCNGYFSSVWDEDATKVCRGTLRERTRTYTYSHQIVSSYTDFNPNNPVHSKDAEFYEIYCDSCGNPQSCETSTGKVVFRKCTDSNFSLTCDEHQYTVPSSTPGSTAYMASSFSCGAEPRYYPGGDLTANFYNIVKSRTQQHYSGGSVWTETIYYIEDSDAATLVGKACKDKYYVCQYCYQGGQTEIYVCGCDTYNYYDINKNVTPDVCDKVVNDIAPIKI